MKQLLLITIACFCLSKAFCQSKQSIEIIWNLSSDNDTALVYYHIKTNYNQLDKKIKDYPVHNIHYMSPDEVFVDSLTSSIDIDNGEFSVIEMQPKSDIIKCLEDSSFLFSNIVPIEVENNFNLSAFMWILPEKAHILDHSCNAEGKFIHKNNTLIFTAKEVNNLQFKIHYKNTIPEKDKIFAEISPVPAYDKRDTLMFYSIYYNLNQWKYKSSDLSDLKILLKDIKDIKNYQILVSGYTDNTPFSSSKTNWELSSQRASNIVNCLISLGIPENNISASFHSHFQSSKNNDQSEKDRRVDICVLSINALDVNL